MKYLLSVKDLSGRGQRTVHRYEKEREREDKFVLCVTQEGATEDEVEEMVTNLDRGQAVVYNATEYMYL